MSLGAAERLQRVPGLSARVLDLRWIAPLPIDDVGFTHEPLGGCSWPMSVGAPEALAAAVLDANLPMRFARVTSADSFIPLGDAAGLVLLNEDEIVEGALALCGAQSAGL
jgi:2-oxoisovalerate dehydrogenase E1 component